MHEIRIGIVGTGMIAQVIARASQRAEGVKLYAVASREQTRAMAFAQTHGAVAAYAEWQALVEDPQVDAVYVATPTAGREAICLAAIARGKHLISEKPFLDAASARRIASAARDAGVAFMDATHFTHHPRTVTVRRHLAERLGGAQRLASAFFFPFDDRNNIRFDPRSEPSGAIGDMGWYSMRAIVEYLQPQGLPQQVVGALRRDGQTNAIVGGSGMMLFADGRSSLFDFGYDAGVCQMDLNILGSTGLIQLDDFVLDWKEGFAFDNPAHLTGFVERQGMSTPEQFTRIATPASKPQASLMLEGFTQLVRQPEQHSTAAERTVLTQTLLDAFAAAAR